MVSVPTVFAVVACLAPFASLASAQDAAPPFELPEVRSGDGAGLGRPVLHVTYDVQHDRIRSVRTVSPGELGLVDPPCFDNSNIYDPGTYVVADAGQEVLNWGVKNCPGASRLRSFTILYSTEAIDPSQGGPGGTLGVALYSGTRGFGVPGHEIFRRIFTGLPRRAPGTPGVFVTIDFGTEPLPLDDGRFGWGFLQLDGDTGPVLVIAPRASLGTVDAMDIYSPGPARPETYLGTFNYANSGIANTFIQLDEIGNGDTANVVVMNGTDVNPATLREILPARIGGTWAARIEGVPQSLPLAPPTTVLFLSTRGSPPIPTPQGELLIDWGSRFASLVGEASYAIPIPPDQSLVGLRLMAQGYVRSISGTPAYLTNALRVRMGY